MTWCEIISSHGFTCNGANLLLSWFLLLLILAVYFMIRDISNTKQRSKK